MVDAFLDKAGAAPARNELDRWRQVALLGVSAAAFDDERARVGLAAALLALDCPAEAGRLLIAAAGDDPWVRWWTVIAVGQAGGDGLASALSGARSEVAPRGSDGREVARRLADLDAELSELTGDLAGSARFSVLGHRARPERRALIGGRSSAVFLVDPSWDSLRLVRLAPSDGPSMGNAAQWTFAEVIEAVRRGDGGPGRRVPADEPGHLEPGPMLDALCEDPATRDGRLLRLATEVREERERLAGERADLAAARMDLAAERERLKRIRAATKRPAIRSRREPPVVPKTAAEAAELLGVAPGASRTTVQRYWREQVAKCHPDLVDALHPALRARAEDLAAALNAARDLLIGDGAPARSRRRG